MAPLSSYPEAKMIPEKDLFLCLLAQLNEIREKFQGIEQRRQQEEERRQQEDANHRPQVEELQQQLDEQRRRQDEQQLQIEQLQRNEEARECECDRVTEALEKLQEQPDHFCEFNSYQS